MNKELSSFNARLREQISSGGRATRVPDSKLRDGDSQSSSLRNNSAFNQHALELFALQFKYNAAYQEICSARGVMPEEVEDWTQIPAVPTTAFKELELSSLPPEERTAVFHSSGTTEQRPSRHFHNSESLSVYETSLWQWFKPNFLANSKFKIQNSKLVVLTPPPAQAPHSSLVHMFESIRSHAGESADRSFFGTVGTDDSWVLDFEAMLAVLNSSLVTRQPSLLLGTAFSFVHLLDYLGEHDLRFQLAPGSRVMETGGYKNHSRTMPKEELHALITERLGVPAENIICEYGMSELSSQAYALTGDKWHVTRSDGMSCHLPAAPKLGSEAGSRVTRHFHFPPWTRVQIVSPETGRDVPEGETGLVRVFDLANICSVMAVQTEDLGVRRGDGFELIGRAQFVEPRGCSLMNA